MVAQAQKMSQGGVQIMVRAISPPRPDLPEPQFKISAKSRDTLFQACGRADKVPYKVSKFASHDPPTDQCAVAHYETQQKASGFESGVIVTGGRITGKSGV
jgi:hypothetical protein